MPRPSIAGSSVAASSPASPWRTLEPDDPTLADGLLVCTTEVTTSAEIEAFAVALEIELAEPARPGRSRPMSATGPRLQPTIFERSRPGRGGGKIPHPPRTRSSACRPTSAGRSRRPCRR